MIDNGEGIGYVGDLATWSVYQIWTENRPVLEMTVDNTDPDLCIWIGRPGARKAVLADSPLEMEMFGVPEITKGRAQRNTHEVGGTSESPGDLQDHIDGISVYRYVLPRAVTFMARVYLPKPVTEG